MCALAISYLGRYVRDAESQMYGKMYQLQRDLYLLGFEDIGQYRQVSYKTVQEASKQATHHGTPKQSRLLKPIPHAVPLFGFSLVLSLLNSTTLHRKTTDLLLIVHMAS